MMLISTRLSSSRYVSTLLMSRLEDSVLPTAGAISISNVTVPSFAGFGPGVTDTPTDVSPRRTEPLVRAGFGFADGWPVSRYAGSPTALDALVAFNRLML